MSDPFEFLAPLADLEAKIAELHRIGADNDVDMSGEIASLTEKLTVMTRQIFGELSPWQRVLLSRHPERPQASDYIDHMVEDFVPLAGDRSFADDTAILCGLGRIGHHDCLFIGQEKGKDVHERRRNHFGMPHPEGYRKAMAKMRLAEKFDLPVITMINAPGAYPGIGAEERGQSIAIAENIRDMSHLRVPIIAIVIGEGGSGGALAIGVGDRILMLENSYYSVITPEGCAAILWKDGSKAERAAACLKVTPEHLLELGVIDGIVEEPAGGAHRHVEAMASNLQEAIVGGLDALVDQPIDGLIAARYDKYRGIGAWA